MAKFGIQVRNVIGHGESLQSPLRFERYASWRCMTHSDMSRAAMITYRGRLRDRARAAGVPIGPRPGLGRYRLLIVPGRFPPGATSV